jgi:hypothetical protein
MFISNQIIINILEYCDVFDDNVRLCSRKFKLFYDRIFHDKIKELFLYYAKNYGISSIRKIVNRVDNETLHEIFMKTLSNESIIRYYIINSINFDPSYNNYEIIKLLIERYYFESLCFIAKFDLNDDIIDLIVDCWKSTHLHYYGLLKPLLKYQCKKMNIKHITILMNSKYITGESKDFIVKYCNDVLIEYQRLNL